MDAYLKQLAEVSLAVDRAEVAVEEHAYTSAREAADEAERGLQDLREHWPKMSTAERGVIGKAAATVKRRLDTVQAALPKTSALQEGSVEDDPEQEIDPAA